LRGCPILRAVCEGWEADSLRSSYANGVDFPQTGPNPFAARVLASRPCPKARKDGAPFLGKAATLEFTPLLLGPADVQRVDFIGADVAGKNRGAVRRDIDLSAIEDIDRRAKVFQAGDGFGLTVSET
jgi:hypothetical protein